MVRLSKEAKARIKRMPAKKRGELAKASLTLADCGLITYKRYQAIARALNREQYMPR